MSNVFLRNPARIAFGVVFLTALALIGSQAFGAGDPAAAPSKEKFESAFARVLCQTDLLQRMEPIQKHLKWLSEVRLTAEGGKKAAEKEEALWAQVLPFLERELQKRGASLEDLKAILLAPAPADRLNFRLHFAFSIQEKATAACLKLHFAKDKIVSAMLAIMNRAAPLTEQDFQS